MSGRRPKKIHRQSKASATKPAIPGPSSPGRIQAVDSVANIRGRRCSGRLRPIATYAIGGMAPPPMPWIRRAAMSMGIDVAAPASISPIVNSASPMTNGSRTPRRSIRLPATTIPTSDPTRNAENTRPYSSSPPRSRATMGIAAVTASASAATSVIVRTSPTVSGRRAGDHRPPSSGGTGTWCTARLSGCTRSSARTSVEYGASWASLASGITGA